MTAVAPTKENTLHLKNNRKPKGHTADKPLEVPKHEKADLDERRPPKKPKDYKLQYKGKEDGPMAESHKEWRHLEAYHRIEQARLSAHTRMTGNALTKMFDYRILDKDGKECSLK